MNDNNENIYEPPSMSLNLTFDNVTAGGRWVCMNCGRFINQEGGSEQAGTRCGSCQEQEAFL